MGLPSVGVTSRVPFYLACPQRRKAEWVKVLVAPVPAGPVTGSVAQRQSGPWALAAPRRGTCFFFKLGLGAGVGLNLCGRGDPPCLMKVRQDRHVQGRILPLFKMLAFCPLWIFFSASVLIQPHYVKIVSFIIITEFWGTPFVVHLREGPSRLTPFPALGTSI